MLPIINTHLNSTFALGTFTYNSWINIELGHDYISDMTDKMIVKFPSNETDKGLAFSTFCAKTLE